MILDAQQVLSSCLDVPGLYLHVPFCQSLCPFCPYNKVVYQPELVRRYFSALQTEIKAYTEHLKAPLTSLYIGGGTPTLCLEELATLIPEIPVVGERAIETLPTHATLERIEQMQQMGITFISLGVQSFNTDMLHYLKRPTSVADNLKALETVRGKFDCVDVDLIFDVSFADTSIFLNDLELCCAKGIDQISTYPLMRFGYTPFGKAQHNPQKEHDILHQAEQLTARYGYKRRSVWTFNRQDSPNYSSITRPFFLGVGAGSASYTGRFFLVNDFRIERYINTVQAGNLPIARQFTLPSLMSSAYAVFWQLYTGQVDSQQITQHFGALPGGAWRILLEIFTRYHWLTKKQNHFSLTPIGRDHYHDLERWVTYHMIEPLWAEMTKDAATLHWVGREPIT
jgi:coproporphyrinogen III oxidase-like Fe-S oxidoreductase